jgi:hypothetical protein
MKAVPGPDGLHLQGMENLGAHHSPGAPRIFSGRRCDEFGIERSTQAHNGLWCPEWPPFVRPLQVIYFGAPGVLRGLHERLAHIVCVDGTVAR